MQRALKSAAPSGGPGPDFAGKWRNEIASTMEIEVSGQAVRGRYVSVESSTGQTVQGALVGFVDGDLISFVVNWDGGASLTSWVGQLVEEGGVEKIRTLWHLVLNVPEGPNEPNKLWTSVLTGADTFSRAG